MSKYKEALMGGEGAGILADVKNHKERVEREALENKEI